MSPDFVSLAPAQWLDPHIIMRDGGNGFNRSDAPDGLQGRPADNVYTSTFNLVCCPCGLQFDLLLEERLLSSSTKRVWLVRESRFVI